MEFLAFLERGCLGGGEGAVGDDGGFVEGFVGRKFGFGVLEADAVDEVEGEVFDFFEVVVVLAERVEV